MDFSIDIERLRKDIMDYYGTARFNGFPMAVTDLGEVSNASPEELIKLAREKGIDLTKYKLDRE